MPRSRGPFNTTVKLYTSAFGVRDPDPIASDVPARVVPQEQILPFDPPYDGRVAWITMDAAVPTGPTTSLMDYEGLLNWGFATWIVDDNDPSVEYVTMLVESVFPVGETPYVRCWVRTKWW